MANTALGYQQRGLWRDSGCYAVRMTASATTPAMAYDPASLYTAARTSTGVFTLTPNRTFPGKVVAIASLGDQDADGDNITASVNDTTQVITINMFDASGTATDGADSTVSVLAFVVQGA